MKKFLALFISVCLVMALLAGAVPVARAAEGDFYTVTFNSGAGSPNPDPITGITSGATITLPEAPILTGSNFLGWYSSTDGITATFDATTPVTADITVFANYMLIPTGPPTFTVTFDSQGGSGVLPESISFGGFAYLPEAPTKADFTFASWNTIADGTGTTFTATEQVFADITVYAIYTTGTVVVPVVSTQTGAITIVEQTSGGASQIFYFTMTGFPTPPDFILSLNNMSSQFNELAAGTYTITEQPVEGYTLTSIAGATSTDLVSGTATILLAEGATSTVTFTNNAEIATPPPASATYTVTFVDFTPTPVVITGIIFGATVELPPAPTKEGFTFKGWSTTFDGNGPLFTAATPVIADIPVFASFTPVVAVPVIGGSPATVVLGTAGDFSVLAEAGISTTGASHVNGDMGISPAGASALTGFDLILEPSFTFSTSSLVTGKIYTPDYNQPTPAKLNEAVNAMMTAYTAAAGVTAPAPTVGLGGGTIAPSTILAPGVYKWGTPVTIPTDVTLDAQGDTNAVWIFQITGTLDIALNTRVLLTDGAQASNIFWQVGDVVTLHPYSRFEGNLLGASDIALQTGASINGRLLSQRAITLAGGVNCPAPVPVIEPVIEPVIIPPVIEPVIEPVIIPPVIEPVIEPPVIEPVIREPRVLIPSVVVLPTPTLVYYQTFLNGYPDGTFKPDQAITRAEVAAALTRALGLGGSTIAPAYPDVPATHWAASAIQLMKAEGIMIGDTSGKFRPDAPITRAETATALLRLLKVAPIQALPFSSFPDVPTTYWAAGYIQAMQGKGYINGYPDGTFKPTSNLLRAEATAILDRVLGREISEVSQIKDLTRSVHFSDVPATHWAYLYILEASTPYTLTNATRLGRNLTLTGKTIPLYSTETAPAILHKVGEVLTAIVPTDGLLKGLVPVARQVVVVITKKLKP